MQMVLISGCPRRTLVGRPGSFTGWTGRWWTNPCGTLENRTNLLSKKRLASTWTLASPNWKTPAARDNAWFCAKSWPLAAEPHLDAFGVKHIMLIIKIFNI